MNEELSAVAKKMTSITGDLLLLLIAAGIAYHRSLAFLPFAFGASLGAGLNVLKIKMLERTVRNSIDMERKNAANYVRFQYFLRFLITGLLLFLAVTFPFISLWGTIAGLLTMPPAAFYAKSFIGGNKSANGSYSTGR